MTNSQNNESNPDNSHSVPFEVVDTSGQSEATAKPAKIPMEVAGLEPEPEPHEFLSAALGLKPKKKVGANKPAVELATPVDPKPIAEVATLTDPFATAEPATHDTPAEAEASDDELVSVADLGDDEETKKRSKNQRQSLRKKHQLPRKLSPSKSLPRRRVRRRLQRPMT